MERREMLQGVGALAMAGLMTQADAADHDHHHHHAGGQYDALIISTGDCIAKGESCLAHCLVLLGDGDKAMAECAQSVSQMLALCTALQKLAAQNAPATRALARVTLDVCIDCEKSCRKHADKHAECKACAEACKDCIQQCKAIG